MGSYKASKNQQEEQIEEIDPKEAKKQREIANNANTIMNAADVAIASGNPYAMAAGAIVKGADKVTGGRSTQTLGRAMSVGNKTAPAGGKAIQNASNNLAESGAGDAIGTAASIKSGGKGGGASKGAEVASKGQKAAETADKAKKAQETADKAKKAQEAQNNASKGNAAKDGSQKSKSGEQALEKAGKSGIFDKLFDVVDKILDVVEKILDFFNPKTLALCIVVGFFLTILIPLVIIISLKDQANLKLTNSTAMAKSTTGSQYCSSEEITSKTIYVGDSRMNGMYDALGYSESHFIVEDSLGYDWFISDGKTRLESLLFEDSNAVVVFALGLYDLYNVSNYIASYNELIQKYPTVTFYILSVNPVDESRAVNSGYSFINQDISNFNYNMKNSFPANFIDSYSNVSFVYLEDGIHYDNDTYINLEKYINKNINNSKKVICSYKNLEEIEDVDLTGGEGKILESGESLLSLLGQTKIDEWSNSIKVDVQAAGVGSGSAPAIAAYGLIKGALNEGYIIPYFWGGENDVISDGINGSWGSNTEITKDGNSSQPLGSMSASGLDGVGLIQWALKNGGCSSFVPLPIEEFKNLGSNIELNQAVTGDIITNDSHIMLVLSIDESQVLIAESKSPNEGVILNKYYFDELKDYIVVSMGDYYYKNCNG